MRASSNDNMTWVNHHNRLLQWYASLVTSTSAAISPATSYPRRRLESGRPDGWAPTSRYMQPKVIALWVDHWPIDRSRSQPNLPSLSSFRHDLRRHLPVRP